MNVRTETIEVISMSPIELTAIKQILDNIPSLALSDVELQVASCHEYLLSVLAAVAAYQGIEAGTAPQCPHCIVYMLDEATREYHLICGECGVPFCLRSPQCPRETFDRHPRD